MDIFSELSNTSNFTPAESNAMRRIYDCHELKKGDVFVKKGDSCKKIGLLETGALYSASYDDNGNQQVQNFYVPKVRYVVFDYQSYLSGNALQYDTICYRDAKLWVTDIDKIMACYDEFPKFYQVEVMVIREHFLEALNRVEMLKQPNAVERIKKLKKQYPELFRVFPSGYIASFLGMHRNTYNKAFKQI